MVFGNTHLSLRDLFVFSKSNFDPVNSINVFVQSGQNICAGNGLLMKDNNIPMLELRVTNRQVKMAENQHYTNVV